MTKLLPCVISSLGGISYPKKRKKRKEKKLKLVENLKKKKKLEIFLTKFSYKISCNLKLQSYLIK